MRKFLAVLAALVALAGGTVAVIFSLDARDRPKVEIVFGVTLDEQGVHVYRNVQERATDAKAANAEVALRNEAPPGSAIAGDPIAQAAAQVAAEETARQETTGPDAIAEPQTLAEPSQEGCASGPWVVNQSSRNGARPAMLVAHLTVSRNVAGWADVDAITAWFNNPRAQASSNYVIDGEGNCRYIVNEAAKAWTQGFQNPWSISIEFIHFSPTDPNEPWPEAQLRKGARVFADASKRWGIPVRLVNPTGCEIVAGITDHDRLECGNEHVDVGTREPGEGVHQGTFPMTTFIRYVTEAKGATKARLLPCTVRNVRRRLNAHPAGHHWAHPPSPRLVINGVYGPHVKAQVIRFRWKHGLPKKTTVGPRVGRLLALSGCDGSIR